MSAVTQTPGDRACRYALGADTILRVHAESVGSDLAWGLHRVSEDASNFALSAIESGAIGLMEDASWRYSMALAVLGTIAHESNDDMLLAAEGLMEATKLMLDTEVGNRLAVNSHSLN